MIFLLLTYPIITTILLGVVAVVLLASYTYIRRRTILWKNESAAYIHTEAIMDSIDEVPETLVVINKEGRIIYVNSSSETMFGLKESDLLEKTIYKLLPYDSMETVERAKKEDHRQEFAITAKGKLGKELPLLVTVSTKEKPTGATYAFVLKDISHRKLGEDARRNALEDLKKDCELLSKGEELLQSGAWHWDMGKEPDEVTYSKGFAKLFDVPVGLTVPASRVMECIYIEDRELLNNKMVAAMNLAKGYEAEYRIVRRNGRKDLIKWMAYPELTENQKIIKYVGTVQLIKQNV